MNPVRGLIESDALDGSSYTSPSESGRTAVAAGNYAIQGCCPYAVALSGEADAVVYVRIYDAAADGLCRVEFGPITLDSAGRGGDAVVAVPFLDGMWWTIESDTSGDYEGVLSICPPSVSP